MTAFAYWLRDPSVALTYVTTPEGNTYRMGYSVGAINSPVAKPDLDALLSPTSAIVRYIDGELNMDPLFHGVGGSSAGGSLGVFATTNALETAYPAASKTGYHASVGGSAPYLDHVSNGVEWVPSAGSGLEVVALSGTKNGVNATFTLPDANVATCIPVWNGVIQVEGVDFTRVGATITMITSGKPGASDTLQALVGGSPVPVSVNSALVMENLTPAPDGVNNNFVIPTPPTSWCQIISGPLVLAEGVGYTRSGANVTVLAGFTPAAGVPFYPNHD